MMNKKEILRKVGGIITELNEQYEYLSQSSENLNELELELFAANANFLSDHITILIKLNESEKRAVSKMAESPVNQEAPATKTPIHREELQQEEKTVETTIPNWKFELEKDEEVTFPSTEKSSHEVAEQAVSSEENRRVNTPAPSKPEPEKESEIRLNQQAGQEPVSQEPIVKEVVISERTVALPIEPAVQEPATQTLNDLLSKQSLQRTVASQINQRQIKDLKSMISLNDKLLFVRDLFNGYSLAYSEAIEFLNRFDTFEAAENFLKQNYAHKNKWDEKQAAADKFFGILSERFI